MFVIELLQRIYDDVCIYTTVHRPFPEKPTRISKQQLKEGTSKQTSK